jgi:hypothetical protein
VKNKKVNWVGDGVPRVPTGKMGWGCGKVFLSALGVPFFVLVPCSAVLVPCLFPAQPCELSTSLV